MKITNTLRILAGLSFLIFFCPFFQMCSDEQMPGLIKHIEPIPPDSIAADSLKVQAWEKSIAKEEEAKKKTERQAYVTKHRKELILNAYEVSYEYGNITSKGNTISSSDLDDPLFYFVIFFLLSVIIAIPLFISALLKKSKAAFVLSCINMVFLILYSLCLFIPDSSPIEHLYQVKFGYYLFIINSIALIFVSYKAKKQTGHAV